MMEESSINTRSSFVAVVVMSRGSVERGESEVLRFGISAYKVVDGETSSFTDDTKQASIES